MSDNQVLAKWNEVRELVAALELDATKSASGVAAAGVRLRRGLRAIKALSTELVKLTIQQEKTKKESK